MTSMNRRFRELRKQVGNCGLHLESLNASGGSHLKLVVRRADGKVKTIFVSLTPSDNRAALNNRAILRRFAREGL